MHLTRLTLCAATVLTLSAELAAARPVTTVAETNLRKGPATSAESLGLIPKGTTVEVDKCDNGWCEVKWNDQAGFAFAGNVVGPALGGVAPRPPGRDVKVAADFPSPGRPPVVGGPPPAGPPVAYDDDDEYGPPPVAYRPAPPGYFPPPPPAYGPPPGYGPGYGPSPGYAPPPGYGPPPSYYDPDWRYGRRRW